MNKIEIMELATNSFSWEHSPIGGLYYADENAILSFSTNLLDDAESDIARLRKLRSGDVAALEKLRSALNAMLSEMGMDENEYNKATFDMARKAINET